MDFLSVLSVSAVNFIRSTRFVSQPGSERSLRATKNLQVIDQFRLNSAEILRSYLAQNDIIPNVNRT
jgi:hypothetical protein